VRRKNAIPYLYTFLIISTCIGLVMINRQLPEQFPLQDKFASHWIAAKVWVDDGTSPYDDQVFDETKGLLSDKQYTEPLAQTLRFYEPVFNLILYLPFGFINYELARAIWLLIIEVSVCASILISLKIAGWKVHPIEAILLTLVGLIWYPSLKSILFGDPVSLYVFLILLAVWLVLNHQGTAAGFLLAFTSGLVEVSFFIAVFLIIWRLTRKDSSILFSYLAGIAFMAAISWILFPGWFTNWISALIQLFPGTTILTTPLMRIANLFPGAETPLNYVLHIGVIVYVLLEWFDAFGKTGRIVVWKIALTLCLVYFLNIQSQSAYLFLLLPAVFMILRFISERWKILGRIFSWFLIGVLTSVYWYVFLNRGGWDLVEPSLILLLLPLMVIAGMNWIRWWAIQKPDPAFT